MIARNRFKVIPKKTVATGETNPCEIRGTKKSRKDGYFARGRPKTNLKRIFGSRNVFLGAQNFRVEVTELVLELSGPNLKSRDRALKINSEERRNKRT